MMALNGWEDIPEPPLLTILSLLSVKDVLSCGLVCSRWRQIADDEILWKRLLCRDMKAKISLKPQDVKYWKDEYIRLVDRVPKIQYQTLAIHQDEVLHATFSHDGLDLVSCSKDNTLNVWKRDGINFHHYFMQDMEQYGWIHTWAAQFNSSDTLLMVTGVISEVNGEVAVFSTGREEGTLRYTLVCYVINDPYDVLGCWCTESLFISGMMNRTGLNTMDAPIYLCQADRSELEIKFNPLCYRQLLFNYQNSDANIYVRYIQAHKRKGYQTDYSKWTDGKPTPNPPPKEELDKLTQAECSELVDEEICLIFMCGDKTKIPHQLGFQRISMESLQDPPILQRPERVIDFDGHVIGYALSPDNKYIYVNVRTWPTNAIPDMLNPPPIANQIELQMLDLETLEKIGGPFMGHQGFTPTDMAFYLYVDVSENLVASGSEDNQGVIWDRKYKTLVSRMAHDSCVNCVAICPVDEEICVTASDDHLLKVWISRRKDRKRRQSSA